MKTKEELTALKNEVETLNKKLEELTPEELQEVTGGFIPPYPPAKKITPDIGFRENLGAGAGGGIIGGGAGAGNIGAGSEGWEDPKYIL